VGLDLHNLPGVLEGDLDRLIDALITTDQAERLRSFVEQTDNDALAQQAASDGADSNRAATNRGGVAGRAVSDRSARAR
jgi:hypothetical protein